MPSPPELSDTSRTFANDLQFAQLLCQCNNIPPFLVESALDAGYTDRQLYESGIFIGNLLDGGVRADSLLVFGVSVQDMLYNGGDPLQLWSTGVPAHLIYGNQYQGGLIFYIDTLDIYPFEGLLSGMTDLGPASWYCSNDLTDVEGTGIGDGKENTQNIISQCSDPNSAAEYCNNYSHFGYTDWYLPSSGELTLMFERLADEDGNNMNSGPGDPGNIGNFKGSSTGLPSYYYWTSTESPVDEAFLAYAIDFIDGSLDSFGKGVSVGYTDIRPCRQF